MSSELRLGGAPLNVTVNRRARRMRLRVDPRTRSLTLTVPAGVSQRRALDWAAGHAEWAAKSLENVPVAAPLGPGSTIPLLGEPHLVDWSPERRRRVDAADGRILIGGPAEGVEARVLRWLRAEALELLDRETAELARQAKVTVTGVSVGDPRSRWGSCSADGRIRYSWRLVMAPDFVRRATVAHEVAHRVHMDHSPRFHALVRELLGANPAPARAWLRREGATLHRVGFR